MNDPAMTARFIRANAVRIVTGVVLLATGYVCIDTYMTYVRQQRIEKELEAVGAGFEFQFVGPTWLPQTVQDEMPFLNRIYGCDLGGTSVTDANLERLRELTNLRSLDLFSTHVSDAGLAHLKGLSHLESLYLEDTKVTQQGIDMLQEALPTCNITTEMRVIP